jgi:hypothetical protein
MIYGLQHGFLSQVTIAFTDNINWEVVIGVGGSTPYRQERSIASFYS